MSTILKALRRLEEDSAQKPASTPLGSDAELRDRILAEESAAAALDPAASSRADSHSHSASDSSASTTRRGSRPLSTFLASLSPRSLTPIALGLVLLLSVGSAIWYWNGGASSLDPTTASPADPEALAAAPVPRAAVPPRVLPTAPVPRAQPAATPRPPPPPPAPAADTATDRRIAAAPAAAPVVPVDAADRAAPPIPRADRSISSSTTTGVNSTARAAAPSRSTATSNSASTSAAASRPEPAADPIETSSAARVAAVSSPVAPIRPTPPPSGASRPAAGPPVSAAAPSPRPSPSRPAQEVERLDHRGLPDLTVLRTAWHPTPERRTAKVRLEASKEVLNLHEGDAVGGLVVQEISPSSILFQSGDVEIRRRVGQGSTR